MEEEIDPYERQLLAVFKSCDLDGNGVLDQAGFSNLCDALQLDPNRRWYSHHTDAFALIRINYRLRFSQNFSQLTASLCEDGKCEVVFSQFRDALLAVLAALKSPSEEFPTSEQLTSFDISGV